MKLIVRLNDNWRCVMLGERECGKKHLRWKAVSAVAIMSSLLIFSGCDSEEVDYLTHELALNNQNTMSLDDLKQQLFSYDATPDDDGVIYMSEIVDGVEVSTGRTRIEGYVPKRNVRGSDLNDLLRNNASRSIKEKLSNELYKIYSSGEDKDARVEVVVTFVDDLKLPFLEDYDYSVSIKDVEEEVSDFEERLTNCGLKAKLLEFCK